MLEGVGRKMISETALWILSPADARWIGLLCDLGVNVMRRNGEAVPDRLARLLDECSRVAAAAQPPASLAMAAEAPAGKVVDVELTAAAVAELLGCSAQNVRARAQRGTLPARRSPRGWRFDPEAVAEYLDLRGVA